MHTGFGGIIISMSPFPSWSAVTAWNSAADVSKDAPLQKSSNIGCRDAF